MDDPDKVTNEAIRLTFPCCGHNTCLTYDDLGQLEQGEPMPAPCCPAMASASG